MPKKKVENDLINLQFKCRPTRRLTDVRLGNSSSKTCDSRGSIIERSVCYDIHDWNCPYCRPSKVKKKKTFGLIA